MSNNNNYQKINPNNFQNMNNMNNLNFNNAQGNFGNNPNNFNNQPFNNNNPFNPQMNNNNFIPNNQNNIQMNPGMNVNNQFNNNFGNNNFNNNNANNINNNPQMNPQNNQIQINNNKFERKHYQPKEKGSIVSSIQQNSNLIDKNETNEINSIVQQVYSYKLNQDKSKEFMSDLICQKIKHKIQGDWFVLVSDVGKNIPLSFSTVSKSDFLIIILGNTKFQIAKLK